MSAELKEKVCDAIDLQTLATYQNILENYARCIGYGQIKAIENRIYFYGRTYCQIIPIECWIYVVRISVSLKMKKKKFE